MPLLQAITGGESKVAPVVPNVPPNDVSAALKDSPEGGRKPQENGIKESSLISYVEQRFNRSVMYRRPYEQLWLENHRNYRGFYGSDTAFRMGERSRIFVRVTKTKVNAAYGQLLDILFADNKFPIAVEPERLPEGVVDVESVETNPQMAGMYPGQSNGSPQSPQGSQSLPGQQPPAQANGVGGQPPQQQQQPDLKFGYPGDGTRDGEQPDQTAANAMVGQLRQNESIHDGPPQSPSAIEVDVALLSAKKMEKKIQDQLRESNADKHLRHAAFECVNLGTGCIKGPIVVNSVIESVDETGQPMAKPVKRPRVEAVSIWNIYTDPDAATVEESDYLIQRHKLSASQLRGLKDRPGFRPNEIDLLIAAGYNYVRQWWEPMLMDMPMVQPVEKYEVLEFWGLMDKSLALEFGLDPNDIPSELRGLDEIPVNIWTSGHRILRLIVNPFNNGRLPYYLVPYELQPYVIWGIGVPETMADSQLLMNGFMRLAVDNAVLSGNMVFEVDESLLVPGQNYDLFPGKFFRKMGGQQAPAITPHQFPNTAQANIQLYDKARELADEATFPSYTHGQTGINPSLGRTSSGLSMMMGAASVSIRMSIKNFDDYLLAPLGEAMFEFNKLNPEGDASLVGNFVINAGGTDSLMRNEVRSQRIVSLIQLGENPMLAPFFKWPYLIREATRSMEIDPDKATNTEQEAMRMAALIQQMMPPPQQGQQGQTSPQHSRPQKGGSPTSPQEPASSNPNAGQTAQPQGRGFSAAHSQGNSKAPAGKGVS